MGVNLPTIIKGSSTLLDEIERAVPAFPRKHRYQLGQDIRAEALQGALLTQYAMMMKGGRQAKHLQELRVSNDRLKMLLQTAHHLQCFRSANHYEAIAEQARSVGRQCHALLKSFGQHPIGQSAGASEPPAATRDTEYSRHPTGVNA